MASSIGFRMGSFLPTLLFKLRGSDSYRGGTLTHWFMPAFAGRTHFGTYRWFMASSVVERLPLVADPLSRWVGRDCGSCSRGLPHLVPVRLWARMPRMHRNVPDWRIHAGRTRLRQQQRYRPAFRRLRLPPPTGDSKALFPPLTHTSRDGCSALQRRKARI